MQRILISLLLLGIIATDASVTRAQRRRPRDARYVRNHQDVRTAFKEVVSEPRKSTVAIIDKDKRVALGTVVDSGGYLLTKASQLPEKYEIKLADGRRMKPRLIGIHNDSDLAMLKIEAEGLPVVKWKAFWPHRELMKSPNRSVSLASLPEKSQRPPGCWAS